MAHHQPSTGLLNRVLSIAKRVALCVGVVAFYIWAWMPIRSFLTQGVLYSVFSPFESETIQVEKSSNPLVLQFSRKVDEGHGASQESDISAGAVTSELNDSGTTNLYKGLLSFQGFGNKHMLIWSIILILLGGSLRDTAWVWALYIMLSLSSALWILIALVLKASIILYPLSLLAKYHLSQVPAMVWVLHVVMRNRGKPLFAYARQPQKE